MALTPKTPTPFYHLVPKRWADNVRFRREVLERAAGSRIWRQRIWIMCARDLLFFVNTFGVIYEPRKSRELPFITYPIQDHALLLMNDALGNGDVGAEKSRDMALSWSMVTLFLWQWNFYRRRSFMLVSRTEDLVDKTDDSDSLFWKIDYILRHLPSWLKPTLGMRDRSNLHLRNPSTESLIDGASTTGNIGRGGRRTAVGVDEHAAFPLDDGYRALASTQLNTNTRIFGSTPQGATGAFYDIMHTPDMDILRLKMHWSEHPLKYHGLYTSHEGKIEIIDTSYRFPPNYQFILDGKLRSPWYDHECRRSPIPTLIAQELDIDYCGSAHQAFDREVIYKAIKRDARPPTMLAELDYEPESAEPSVDGIQGKPHGRLKLWAHIDAHGRLPVNEYVIGADIAWGTLDSQGRGATPSAASIYNRRTGVKVGALLTAGVDPKAFAKYVVALARWLIDRDGEGAFLIWEANGPGHSFGDEVIRLGYRNIFYRRKEEALSKKQTDLPGWWSGTDLKIKLLTEYQRALATGECCNRDEEALRECEQYVVLPDRSWAHMGSVSKLDPTIARENHGDRTIADAVSWHAIVSVERFEEEEDQVPENSIAGRRLRRDPEKREVEYW